MSLDEPDEDDLDFARETLGPDATEDEVRTLAEQRVSVRLREWAREEGQGA